MPRHNQRVRNDQALSPAANPQLPQAPEVAPAEVGQRSLIGTGSQYIPPVKPKWQGSLVGYRPREHQARPVVQPNRV